MDPATDEPSHPGVPRLDRRTILVCVAIAAVAAIGVFVGAAQRPRRRHGHRCREHGLGDDRLRGQRVRAPEPRDHVETLVEATRRRTWRSPASTAAPSKLSDYRGQKLVVNFFASTCVPCKKEMPALQRVHRAPRRRRHLHRHRRAGRSRGRAGPHRHDRGDLRPRRGPHRHAVPAASGAWSCPSPPSSPATAR